MESPYDEWSRNIHAVITFLKPFFDDWRSYASLVSALLGIGVVVMENQVLLRMRMGRWEILGYILWCIISAILGPVFDIIVMLGLFAYCRQKSAQMQITQESIAKALLPPPNVSKYRAMGIACVTASFLTLCSNVLYMLRGWEEPLPFYDWSSNAIRWMTSQIWYAIGMVSLFHVVTRPAQSGVVLFGKFPADIWSFKWYLCVLYLPVRYILLELCDVHRDNKHILIPLEIVIDIILYNGPFLSILLRLLYLSWTVAYDEALLTGALYESDRSMAASPTISFSSLFFGDSAADHPRRGSSTARPGTSGYVGLSMMDLDEAERGQSLTIVRANDTRSSRALSGSSSATSKTKNDNIDKRTITINSYNNNSITNNTTNPPAYDSRDYTNAPKMLTPKSTPKTSPRLSPRTSPKTSSPLRNVVFSLESSDDEEDDNEDGELQELRRTA